MIFEETTDAIRVAVEPVYLRAHSSPGKSRFTWAYRVRVENGGDAPVQLIRRHWEIIDGAGHRQEVRGQGVVGKTPTLAPGEVFEYASGASLRTPSGFMSGHYEMRRPDGAILRVRIPAFPLDRPEEARALH